MNYIKHTSISFLNQNHLKRKELTFKKLLHTARQNGYIVKSYADGIELIAFYGLYERAQKSSSFSITDDSGNTIIFIDDTLAKSKQLFALAHEIGHIRLEHKPCKDKKTKNKQEREANLFAHYLLTGTAPLSLNTYIIIIVLLCIALILLLLNLPTSSKVDSAKQETKGENVVYSNPATNITTSKYISPSSVSVPSAPSVAKIEGAAAPEVTDETVCYFTPSGEVYHLYADCSYLRNSKTVYSAPISESNKDRLCSRCANR